MLLLGSERSVTQDYRSHGDAEDYAGEHLSVVKILGEAKVVKVVNKYIAYEDTINYYDYLNNKANWSDGTYYNCISITGKKVRYHQSELDGNQVELECYDNDKKRYIIISHLAEVYVNVGDVIDSNTIIGSQGNTGIVLSKKDIDDNTYGSHIHIEVLDENYQSINPREYSTFGKTVNYIEQTNVVDSTKQQIKVIADKITIKEKPSKDSLDIGNVYNGEFYDVLDIVEDVDYTWFNIKTSLGVTGYVTNELGKKWIVLINEKEDVLPSIKEVDEIKELRLIFTCEKDGMYVVKLRVGEKLYLE